MMLNDFSNIPDYFMMTVMSTLLIILIFTSKPAGRHWKTFRKSIEFFGLACFILIASNLTATLQLAEGDSALRDAIMLGVSYFQALLFTALPIVMLHAKSRFIHHIPYQVSVLATLFIALLASVIFSPTGIFPWLFPLSIVGYYVLCLFYSWAFRQVYLRSVRKLEAYYDDDMRLRTYWMCRMFCVALFIGLLVPFGIFFDTFYDIFLILASLLYTYLLTCILRYIMTGQYVLQVSETKETGPIEESKTTEQQAKQDLQTATQTDGETTSQRYQQLEENLRQWVEHKEYIKTDVGVEEIAQSLNTNYANLCHYFSEIKGTTFRNWRTTLRIEESKRIMRQQHNLSIREVAVMVGFNDRANFYRYFQKYEGMTPADYREKIEKEL